MVRVCNRSFGVAAIVGDLDLDIRRKSRYEWIRRIQKTCSFGGRGSCYLLALDAVTELLGGTCMALLAAVPAHLRIWVDIESTAVAGASKLLPHRSFDREHGG